MDADAAVEILRCPRCRASIRPAPGGAACIDCGAAYSDTAGYLDLLAGSAEEERPPSALQRLMENPLVARVYERYWRPFFLGALGSRGIDFESEYTMARSMLDLGHGRPLLDLSCGPALYTRRFAHDDPEGLALGLDRSRAMLAHAVHGAYAPNLSLVRGDALDLPLQDGAFGSVFNSAALHLYPDVDRALREVKRVLRAGGVYVANTFLQLTSAAGALQKRLVGRFGWRLFDERELREVLEGAGFVGYERVLLRPIIQFRVRVP